LGGGGELTLHLKTVIPLAFVLMTQIAPFPTAGIRANTEGIRPLWGPYITGTTENLTIINWKTEEPTWGVVQYATGERHALDGSYQDLVLDPILGQLHQVRLTGLQPAEAYRYRIWILDSDVSRDSLPTQAKSDVEDWLRDHGASTQESSFRTLGGQSFAFVVYGDSQEQEPWFTQMDRHKLVADHIAREEGVSFVVHLGDFVYDADDMKGWDDFFEAAREMLANNTIYPVMGNHEHYSPLYYEIFGKPEYYSFRSGQARFLVLDTNSRADFEAQRRWLQDELCGASRWDFVFYHHPPYSSDARNYGGWGLSRKHWEDVFAEADVNAVFSGHSHAYERYLVRGLNYFVVGTGGGALADLGPDAPAGNQNRLAKTLGYARVTVDSDQVTVDFVKVARVSDDNRHVLKVYPFGSVFETVTLERIEVQHLLQPPEADFRVSPVSLSIDVDRDGSSRFKLRITSSDDAQIHVDTEDLPFELQPAAFRLQGSEQAQKVGMELFGNEAIPNGKYEGKLTLLCDAGDNVALGVKIGTTVSQSGEGMGRFERLLKSNVCLVIAVIFVVAANVGGYVAYRRYRARTTESKDA
jgi:predicted phosphodiesterase